MAGAFTVEAFDLAATPAKLGTWTFDLAAARAAWSGGLMSYQYVLTCPWQSGQGGVPKHDEVTIKVTFRDELTGREFAAQRVVKVKLPAAGTSTTDAR